jgi:hypothetical protein
MAVKAQLPAIEALIAHCERNAFAPPRDLTENARDELESYRRMSRVLRALGARQRARERRSRIGGPS